MWYNNSMEDKIQEVDSTQQSVEVAQVEVATVEKEKVDSTNKTTKSKWEGKSKESLMKNKVFLQEASDAVLEAMNEIVDGQNPSAKFLVQHLEGQPSSDIYATALNTLSPTEEYIEAGQGAEYILTNSVGVNRLDETQFVPEIRNDIEKYTYVDEIKLPQIGPETPHCELSVALWRIIQYYLSGKTSELASQILDSMNTALNIKYPFIKLMRLLKKVFSTIYAKQSTTPSLPTNHLEGDTSKEIVTAIAEAKDFVYKMYSDNNVFNYGIDKEDGSHQDYTDTYNNCKKEDLIAICSYETKNAMLAASTTFQNVDAIREYLNVGELVVLPESYYDVDIAGFDPTKRGTLKKVDVFTDGSGNRVKGAILFIDRRNLKRLYNWTYVDSQVFVKNATTEYVSNKNFTFGILKWCQCAVYNNEVLEKPLALNVVVSD